MDKLLASRQFRNTVILIFLVFSLYIVGNTISICIYSSKDEAHTADVIIVLGAGTSEQMVSPVYRERLNHGIDLYKKKYAKKLLVTGGVGKGNLQSDAYTAKQYLINMGIQEDDILMEEESTITQENLQYAKEIMKEKFYSSAIIVSDPLHMKRAMLLAKDIGLEAYSSPTPTTMYRSLRTKIPFLAREVFYYMGYKLYRINTYKGVF